MSTRDREKLLASKARYRLKHREPLKVRNREYRARKKTEAEAFTGAATIPLADAESDPTTDTGAIPSVATRQDDPTIHDIQTTPTRDLEYENEQLRQANKRLFAKMRQYKDRTDDLVRATIEGARDAMLSLGKIPPAPHVAAATTKATEAALWHMTDWQGSKVTTSYNSEVMRERVMRFCRKAAHITAIQRAHHPVNECIIALGGDMVEGLFQYPAQPFEIDATIFGQFVTVSRLLVDVVQFALTTYPHVRVVAEWGNHGRIGSKRSAVPRADNIDRMTYELARQLLSGEDRLTWEDCPEDIQRIEIGNYRALLCHGDEIGRNGFSSPQTLVRSANQWRSGAYPWEFRDVYCVDPGTQALTPSGWRSHDELGVGDFIATMHPETANFEWQPLQRVHSREHRGAMVHHDGRSMDHLSTPDHDMWVRHHAGEWGKRKSIDVPCGSNWLYRCSAMWWQGTWNICGPLRNAPSKSVALFLGWYLGDGHASAHNIGIAESSPERQAKIAQIIQSLGYHASMSANQVRLCHTQLALWIREEFGHLAPNKHMPLWVKDWDMEHLALLFQGLMETDGHVTSCGFGYTSTSRQLVEDIQEIALKLGYASTMQVRDRGNRMRIYSLGLSYAKERTMPVSKRVEDYDGLVWCPTVPNGLWFARRNGRVAVTGNCGHYHTHNSWSLANGQGTLYQSGSTESDNRYARETMASSAEPSQRLHFIDTARGRTTAEYKIHLLED